MASSTDLVSTPAIANYPFRGALLLGALGVVFGDIGTSPIYAFRESLRAAGDASREATVLGILSLVFWAIVLVVALKYVCGLTMRVRAGQWPSCPWRYRSPALCGQSS
jgi:KUP system potassium uptake protein